MKIATIQISLIFLLLACMESCTPPIWNKMQKRAAIIQGLATIPEHHILWTDDFENWNQNWVDEAEVPAQIRFLITDSCLDVIAPKGLTLWNKTLLKGNIDIRYQIRAVSGSDPNDRCSDLNCFWMASDPLHPDSIFARKDFRAGVFGKYYSLNLYYVGYGGNSNSTTRFRRYDGQYDTFVQSKQRPSIQKEYTDSEHLIKPNHWYQIMISVKDGRVQYWSDNVMLFEYLDPAPLTKGWFGMRTTQNHFQVRHFTVSIP
ncbi:MAG TPA: DUF6250 domain-containing protein [Bacteroidales bacterium]|nr:DUF6250 domain-containing protein [Bacteroidales bacterium]